MTTVSGGPDGSVDVEGRTADETPLLSDTGREFLDGKVDAEAYVERARDVAVHKVRQEMYQTIVGQRRRFRRRIALGGLIIAIIGYALLGVATSFSSKDHGNVAIIAFGTASVIAIFVVAYGWNGGRDGSDSGDRDRSFRGLIDHFFYLFLSADSNHEPRHDQRP
jgi:hypothetical protein